MKRRRVRSSEPRMKRALNEIEKEVSTISETVWKFHANGS